MIQQSRALTTRPRFDSPHPHITRDLVPSSGLCSAQAYRQTKQSYTQNNKNNFKSIRNTVQGHRQANLCEFQTNQDYIVETLSH